MGDLAEQAALATLRHGFPDLEVVEVIHHDGSNMTEQTENTEGWGEAQEAMPTPPAVTYPERSSDPHNHRYTISVDGRGPMVVVRAQSAQEVNEAFQELLEANTGALLGSFWSAFKGTAQTANGPAAAPQAPPMPQGPQTPPPFGPNVSAPQAPGYQGPPTPPAPPQGGGQWGGGQQQVQDRRPEYQQAGWYKVTVPFPKKGEFDGIAQQYAMQKGKPSENGHYSFNKADKSWYVHPQYAGAFPMFQPVPA